MLKSKSISLNYCYQCNNESGYVFHTVKKFFNNTAVYICFFFTLLTLNREKRRDRKVKYAQWPVHQLVAVFEEDRMKTNMVPSQSHMRQVYDIACTLTWCFHICLRCKPKLCISQNVFVSLCTWEFTCGFIFICVYVHTFSKYYWMFTYIYVCIVYMCIHITHVYVYMYLYN